MSARDMANALLSDMAAAQAEHVPVTLHKFGEQTGMLLKSASCSCGWQARVWYASEAYVGQSFARHMKAVIEGSTVPWMRAPESSGCVCRTSSAIKGAYAVGECPVHGFAWELPK